jgi:hypothetical protein
VQTGCLAEAADEKPPVTSVLASGYDSLDVANVFVGAVLGAPSKPSLYRRRDERASIKYQSRVVSGHKTTSARSRDSRG